MTILVDEYVLALALFIPLHYLIGERWEIIGLGNSYYHLLVLPLFLWLPISLIRRRYWVAVIAGVPLLFLIAVYGVTFVPRTPTTSSTVQVPHLKLLTYNIHSQVGKDLLGLMIAVVIRSDTDVVALQEVSEEAAGLFSKVLKSNYPYTAFHTDPNNPVIGQGVLSRYPIKADDYWRNDQLPEKLAHQRVEIDVNGTMIAVYNTHPIHPFMRAGKLYSNEIRTVEIDSVLNRARLDKMPVIIMGDFNMADLSDDYQRVTANFGDTYREVGWGMGFTFPDFSSSSAVPSGRTSLPIRPLVRIDYVFHSHDLTAIDALVWPTSGGSDHRPVLATLALPSGR